MKQFSARILALVAALALFRAAPAVAQVTTAEVSGVVTDASGAVLPGVTVTATNVGTGFTRSAISTEKGRYALLSLPLGAYKLTAAIAGFASVVREGVTLSLGQSAELDFRLSSAAGAETVTVVGEAPLIPTTNGAIGKTLSTQEIDSVPSLGRNYMNLVTLAPGTRGIESTAIRIGGNAYYANAWKVDGMDNDQESVAGAQSRITQDAVGEVQIQTNQFSAEFGRALGGAINVVTRSGTNDLHGRAFFYGQNGTWNEKNFFAKALPKPTNKTKNFGVTLSGPITKDKTHFFVSAERILTDNPITIRDPTGGPATNTISPFRGWGGFAKLTHQLNEKHSLQLSYILDKNVTENANVGGIAQPDNGLKRPNRNDNIILSDVGVLSPGLVNTVRLMWQNNDRKAIPNSTQGPQIQRPSSQTGRNAGGNFGQLEKKIQLSDTLTKISGDHTIKTGLSVSKVYGSDWYFETNFSGAYVFDTDRPFNAADPTTYPIRYSLGSGNAHASIDINSLAAFVEDSWKATPNLTLNAGLRYERDSGDAVKTFKNFPDNNNIAPRVSFAWTPGNDKKTSIRGGLGRFYYRLNGNLGVNIIVQGAPPPVGIGTVNNTTLAFPGYPNPSGTNPRGPTVQTNPLKTGYISDGSEVTPFADQISFGVARELGGDFAISADYVNTRGKHYARARDTNYPDPVTGLKPRADYAQLAVWDTNGHMWYDGLLVRLEKRMSHRYQFSLAYTLSKTEDDTWCEFITQGCGPQAWYNYKGDVERAPSAGTIGGSLNSDDDERHHVTLSGLVRLPYGFDLSGVLQYNSKRRFNITTGRDNNSDGVLADRPNIVSGQFVDPGLGFGVQGNAPKNAGIGPDYFAIDARLAKVITLKDKSFRLIGEAFNLTNRVNYNTYQGNIRSATFNQPISARRPRTIQIGAQFDF